MTGTTGRNGREGTEIEYPTRLVGWVDADDVATATATATDDAADDDDDDEKRNTQHR